MLPSPASEVEGLAVARWSPGRLQPIEVEAEPRERATTIQLVIRCGRETAVVVTAEGYVARPIRLTPEVCSSAEPVELDWWPSSTLRGTLTAPPGQTLPSLGRLSLARCPTSSEEQPETIAELPARIENDGTWSASVPSGCLDAKLVVASYSPVRWSGVQATAGRQARLRPARLVWGASLAARVVEPETGYGVADALVSLILRDALEPAAQAAYEGRTVEAEVWQRSDAQGWVRFDGIEPGDYYLVSQPPSEVERAPGFSEALRLSEGEEAVVHELPLPLPASLRLEVELPDSSALREGRWSAHAIPLHDSRYLGDLMRFVRFEAGEHGLLTDLVPGRWEVSLLWSASGWSNSKVAREEVEVPPGGNVVLTMEVTTSVFHGRVTFRGNPVAGELSLVADREGEPANSERAEADEEGRFSAALEPGRYTVDFLAPDSGISSIVPRVRFEDPEEVVEVKLPDGRIEGLVVDADGAPVGDAAVTAKGVLDLEGARMMTFASVLYAGSPTDANGRFELDNLSEGTWTLVAKSGALESEPFVTELSRDELVPGLRLVVHETVAIVARLVSEHGEPIRQGRALVSFPPTQAGELPSGTLAETDPEGKFELRVRPALLGRGATLLVGAPGYARTVVRVPLRPQLSILLPSTPGQLELVPEEGWSPRDVMGLLLLSSDGAVTLLRELASVGQVLDTTLPVPGSDSPAVIPDLAPGTWRLLRVSGTYVEALALLEGQGHLLPTLATFTVQPGVTTQVEVPSDEEEREDREERR